jgi:hypothetical protein
MSSSRVLYVCIGIHTYIHKYIHIYRLQSSWVCRQASLSAYMPCHVSCTWWPQMAYCLVLLRNCTGMCMYVCDGVRCAFKEWHMCVCVYVYVYVCMWWCQMACSPVLLRNRTGMFMYVCIYVYMYAMALDGLLPCDFKELHMCVCVCVCNHVCYALYLEYAHTCTHAYIYTHTHIHIYIYIYTYTHICIK